MPTLRSLAIATVLGFVPGLCYAQNKSACELTTSAALEDVTGHKFGQPQNKSLDDDTLVPFRSLPRIIASSACLYPYAVSDPWSFGGSRGIKVAIWYMERTDAERAQKLLFDEQAKYYRGRVVVRGGYPTLYLPVSTSSYVFKDVPSGLVLLRIQAGLQYSSASTAESEEVNAGKRLASALLGPPNQLPGVVPSDQIVDSDECLRGQTGMSIVIKIKGIRDIPESTYRADIALNLERLGITVFPRNDPPKFPVLLLNVDALLSTYGTLRIPVTVYTLSLHFQQLFPVKAGAAKWVDATTWTTGSFGAMPAIQALSIRDEVLKLIGNFGIAYQKVNGK